MITGLTPVSFENVQTNAGLFVVGVDPATYINQGAEAFKAAVYAAIGNDETCLGATRGGGTFSVTKDGRPIEADGRRYNVKGCDVIDSMDGALSTTLIEMTAGNIKRTFGAADVTKTGKFTKIQPKTSYRDQDYIPVLMWIGDTNYGYMMIVMHNALNTADFNMTFSDKGEATLPVEFHAYQANLTDFDTPPFEMYLLDESAAAGMNVYSVPGSTTGKTLITVNPQKSSSQSYKYKTAASVDIPSENDVLTDGWNSWDGSAEITATNGNQIVVAIVTTADNKCQFAGRTTVVAHT